MIKHEKHNISVPLNKVDAFLGALDKKGISPEESARIANELITALRQARELLTKGIDDKNLTVCIGKGCYVNPAEFQKFLSRQIPKMTIYNTHKDTRHMGLYFKHTPAFYLANPPKRKPGARNRKPKKG
jgi:hypothetical protein